MFASVCLDKGADELWTPGRNPMNIPRPFRAVLVGRPGCGKTSVIRHFIYRADPPYERILLCHPDPGATEWSDLELLPGDVSDRLPSINDILAAADTLSESGQTLLVVDDLAFIGLPVEERKRLDELFRFLSSHKRLSVVLTSQTYTGAPLVARRCSNFVTVWPGLSPGEITIMNDRLGLERGALGGLLKKHGPAPISFDRTPGSPYPLRKSLYEPISE